VSESIVQKQVEAYNSRDVNQFLSYYSQTITIYNHPDELLVSGLDQMKQRYGSFFEQNPELHCEIVNRIVIGPYVIDYEKVTGTTEKSVLEAVAIYRVEAGLIQQVYFL